MRLIYLSCAGADCDHGDELAQRLNTPTFRGHYHAWCWSVRDAVPGTIWKKKMATHLGQAFLFVPLVSASYLADERCYAEMLAALRLKQEGRLVHIMPVLLRPTDIEGNPLESSLQHPRDKQGKLKALTAWKNRDEAWQQVQRAIVQRLTEGSEPDDITDLPQLR